jgi:hypothetical protein
MKKTPGQLAYEKDVETLPVYHDGKPRPGWKELKEWVQYSWERNPTPRNHNHDIR